MESEEFKTINNTHQEIYGLLSDGKEIDISRIENLIEYSLDNSCRITNIEDRRELRVILRFWGLYLTSKNYKSYKSPDIDIDSLERQPKELSSRISENCARGRI